MNQQERTDKLFAEIVEGQKEVKVLEAELNELRAQERAHMSQLSALASHQVAKTEQVGIHARISREKRSIDSAKATIKNIDSLLEDRGLTPEERRGLVSDMRDKEEMLKKHEAELAKYTNELVLGPSLRKIGTDEIEKLTRSLDVIRERGRLKKDSLKAKTQELSEKRLIYSTYLAISNTTKVIPIPDMIGEAPKEEKLASDNSCVVCFERERDHILLPCGDYCVCGTCGKDLKECTICHTKVESIVKMRNY
jgi:hypothetical protein